MDYIHKFTNKFKKTSDNNKEILKNIFGAFFVRGASIVVSLFTMPIYIRFFEDQYSLGIWYTLLSVLNWVLTFDLGLGNGLRNKLPLCLAENDTKKAKSYIASTYIGTVGIILIWAVGGSIFISRLNWNGILNIDKGSVSPETLIRCVQIVFAGILIQFLLKLITSILYAIQRSAIVNLLTLVTSVLTLCLVVTATSGSIEENLIHMAIINALAVNVPYLLATVVVFSKYLKNLIPSVKDVTKQSIKEVLNIGVALLWLQLVFMVISNTNELLISYLTSASSVVQYQAYNKIFSTISSVFTLALTPVWSAVTKAAGERRYRWIKKLNHLLLLASVVILFVELAITPFLQVIIDMWLGEGYITVIPFVAILFAFFNAISFLHNVNTSIGNGMSFFKVQFIWMTFAAIINIPAAIFFVNIFDSWIGVVFANFIALLPFQVFEIVSFERYINGKIREDDMELSQ